MSIVIELTECEFRDQFSRMGRGDNFSYKGLGILYDYFDDLSNAADLPFILDVIGVCCDFSEYDIDDALEEYGCDTLEELQLDVSIILGPFECDGKQHIIIEE